MRARATALVLVNWKGVFYERYLLDRNVTSLEGANGAGKTTVMIAAYVVLLPDMSRLRFTNLGETGATGGDRGIFGRLGEPSRPSYAALELALGPGERLVMGVHLERKAEPSVEPKTFLITQLSETARLSDLFLMKNASDEWVPDLKELAENAARLGAKLELFRSTKDYFAELFERGISPLRLTNEEDRSKLNEMLRTSMTGGISRALTSELRTFLLREEAGLSDALSRMRANLDTVRRTRTEVLEAQRLEREIGGVFEAGRAWLTRSLLAARCEMTEYQEKAAAVRLDAERCRDTLRQREAAFEAASCRERTLHQRLATETRARATALSEQQRVLAAREISLRIARLEREQAQALEGLQTARNGRDERHAGRERARRLRSAAQDGLARAASGLATLEAGLDELYRRAQAHRALREHLAVARRTLDKPQFSVQDAAAELAGVVERLRMLDAESARRARETETAQTRRGEFERALLALHSLVPDAAPETAFECARAELRRLSTLEALAARLFALEVEHQELTRLSARHSALWERARALAITPTDNALKALTLAWNTAENQRSELTQSLQQTELSLQSERERERTLTQRLSTLEVVCAERAQAAERLTALSATLGETLTDGTALERCRERLVRERADLARRATQTAIEREEALALAVHLEAARGGISAALAKLADELDVEVSMTRFEDVEPELAIHLEAVLGPLCEALVVEDPLETARRLCSTPNTPDELWLLSAEQLEALVAGAQRSASADPYVIVDQPAGLRVTRKPESSKLGRRARAHRAKLLRGRALELETELERGNVELGQLECTLQEVDSVAAAVRSSPPGEVFEERGRVSAALADVRERRIATERALSVLRGKHRLAEERVLDLRALLLESQTLVPRPSERSTEDLARDLKAARDARDELSRLAEAHAALSENLEALRIPPASREELERFESERGLLEAQRDQAFLARSSLEYLVEHRAALDFHEAEQALTRSTAIAPSLQEQHALSLDQLQEAEKAVEIAETHWEESTRELQQVEAQALATQALLERERGALSGLAIEADVTEAACEARLLALDQHIAATAREEREVSRELILLSDRLERTRISLQELEQNAELTERAALALETAWSEQRARAAAHGLPLAEPWHFEERARPSAELWADALTQRELLLERLTRARGGGEEVVQRVRTRLESLQDYQVETCLGTWPLVQGWLFRCLPGTVADAPDPVASIAALGRQLRVLEERLARQESDLRGTSEDVARSIEVQIRRAQSQVRRLNQHLTGVRFGSIQQIRIRIGRLERMDQVLTALRDGATQELLFQPSMPIEEALNEIFRRYGGGRNAGQRLLDYREYLELGVEVARQDNAAFEPANPTRLSTGEAIGVGAALMMVVLTEWERDANLFRGKRPLGSLRFLFLDEANRLSHDNLGVLFDLCQSLDLQLLIAAPEVARAEGNTTYRLVRRTGEDGKDEVIVSGRKGLAPAITTR